MNTTAGANTEAAFIACAELRELRRAMRKLSSGSFPDLMTGDYTKAGPRPPDLLPWREHRIEAHDLIAHTATAIRMVECASLLLEELTCERPAALALECLHRATDLLRAVRPEVGVERP